MVYGLNNMDDPIAPATGSGRIVRSPADVKRIAELEAAILAITHRDGFGGNGIMNSYMEDVDLREFAPVLEEVHNAAEKAKRT